MPDTVKHGLSASLFLCNQNPAEEPPLAIAADGQCGDAGRDTVMTWAKWDACDLDWEF